MMGAVQMSLGLRMFFCFGKKFRFGKVAQTLYENEN